MYTKYNIHNVNIAPIIYGNIVHFHVEKYIITGTLYLNFEFYVIFHHNINISMQFPKNLFLEKKTENKAHKMGVYDGKILLAE